MKLYIIASFLRPTSALPSHAGSVLRTRGPQPRINPIEAKNGAEAHRAHRPSANESSIGIRSDTVIVYRISGSGRCFPRNTVAFSDRSPSRNPRHLAPKTVERTLSSVPDRFVRLATIVLSIPPCSPFERRMCCPKTTTSIAHPLAAKESLTGISAKYFHKIVRIYLQRTIFCLSLLPQLRIKAP